MPRRALVGLFLACLCLPPAALAAAPAAPDYAGTAAQIGAAAAHSPVVSTLAMGASAEGRALVAAVVAERGDATPAAAHAGHRAVVFVLSGLAVGDLAGKDAVAAWLGEIAAAPTPPAWLAHVVVVAVPALNADGLARLARHGSVPVAAALAEPFQGTPALVDPARDFLAARAPSVRAWLRLVREWRPDAYVVLRTNLHQPPSRYRLQWSLAPGDALAHPVAEWQKRFAAGLQQALARAGLAAAPCYAARLAADLEAGLTGCAPRPGSLSELALLTNRPALRLVLPRAQPYAAAVAAGTRALAVAMTELGGRTPTLEDAVAAADRAPLDGAPDFALRFDYPDAGARRRFEGYAYTTTLSPISGSVWARYRLSQPKTYFLPWTREAAAERRLPVWPAYALSPGWRRVTALLALHGVALQRLHAPARVALRFYATSARTAVAAPYAATVNLPAGTVVVPGQQPAAKLAAALLEPDSPDSLARVGYFGAPFAAQVPVPDARLEERARHELAADPALARRFAKRVAADPAFAASPGRRLAFFLRHAVSQPPLLGTYPVYGLPAGPPQASGGS